MRASSSCIRCGFVEQLEGRLLMSVTAATKAIRIPVLVYHQMEVVAMEPLATKDRQPRLTGGVQTLLPKFKEQMRALDRNGFDTITTDQFLQFQKDGTLPVHVDRPIMVVFDDNTDDVIPARNFMKNLGYYNKRTGKHAGLKGVLAVPTGQVAPQKVDATDPANRTNGFIHKMTWDEIKGLLSAGWDIASHTVNHTYMGDGEPGHALARSRVTNRLTGTMSMGTALSASMAAIQKEVPTKTQLGFVFPFDDLTPRAILAAQAAGYKLVFGHGSEVGPDALFAGFNTNPLSGQVYRVNMQEDTSTSAFESMLVNQVIKATGEFVPAAADYSEHSTYLASDGTVVYDGSDGPDKFNFNLGTDPRSLLPKYTTAVAISGVNANGHGGDDVLCVTGGAQPVTLLGEGGRDVLLGSDGGDSLNGGGGADKLIGYGGNDVLVGGTGNDHLYGGDGNDTLTGGAGTDYFEGDGGKDTFFTTDSPALVEVINGGASGDGDLLHGDVGEVISYT